MAVKRIIKQIRTSITTIRNEEKRLLKFISFLDLKPGQKILDIGCGYGRYLTLLGLNGFEVVGIDLNKDIVDANVKAGLKCIHESEFNKTHDLYDVLLMSHVIEHFNPESLLKFMDTYLNRLKKGGYLIIATPLFTPYFYIDFDHVKPYYPTGINMVLGNKNDQVQYYSKNKIELVDIWFRRGPFRLFFFRSLYVKSFNKIPFILDMLLILLFRLTFGLMGRTTGWMGLYKKNAP